ncbi:MULTISPECIES: hypothetical protein [unclassified Nonomuraea]|uniref:hypothetical protein n=1 Tax=unclassified Nonomuraea TaxID=2593643 RepID=UPI0033D96EEF
MLFDGGWEAVFSTREAGLVTSHRLGQAVIHTVTDLGGALLNDHSHGPAAWEDPLPAVGRGGVSPGPGPW